MSPSISEEAISLGWPTRHPGTFGTLSRQVAVQRLPRQDTKTVQSAPSAGNSDLGRDDGALKIVPIARRPRVVLRVREEYRKKNANKEKVVEYVGMPS